MNFVCYKTIEINWFAICSNNGLEDEKKLRIKPSRIYFLFRIKAAELNMNMKMSKCHAFRS